MSMEKLLKEKEKIDAQIEKIQAMSPEKTENTEFADAMLNGLEAVPEMLPAAFLPAMMGVELYADALESETVAKRVGMCALVTPLAVPCIALTAIVSLPVAAIAIPTSAVIGSVNTARVAAKNKRIDKMPKALEKLNEKKAKLEEQIELEKAKQNVKR